MKKIYTYIKNWLITSNKYKIVIGLCLLFLFTFKNYITGQSSECLSDNYDIIGLSTENLSVDYVNNSPDGYESIPISGKVYFLIAAMGMGVYFLFKKEGN